MNQQRWLRGDDEASAFDWRRSARDLEVPVEIARALYARALRQADDARRAEALYLRWLRDTAALQRAAPPPVPGRKTQVMHEAAGRPRSSRELAALGPGKWTLSLLEAEREAGAARAAVGASDASRGLPAYDDVQRAVGALGGVPRQPDEQHPVPAAPVPSSSLASGAATLRARLRAAVEAGRGAAEVLATADPATAAEALSALRGEHLPSRAAPVLRLVTQAAGGEVERVLAGGSPGAALSERDAARLSPHVGSAAAGAARLHTDDAADVIAAAHHARALTLGRDIYFARGEYAPGTVRGDELLAHELTHVAQGQRGELTRAAAKGIDSGGQLDPSEAQADLAARLAVIQLHVPGGEGGAPPPLAQPSGQPTSEGDRQARIAAQHQRLGAASQPKQELTVPPPPPATHPQAPVPHQPPAMGQLPQPAPTGNAYVDTFSALPSKQAMELWGAAGGKATTQAAADQAKFDAALPPMPVVLDGREQPGGKSVAGGGRVPGQPPSPGAAPPAAQPTPTPTPPPVTTARAAAQQINPNADKATLKADGQKLIDNLPTTSPDIKTDPGPAPVTDLAGQADPVRTIGDQQHAVGEGAKALDDAKKKVLSGPGAAQIQPVKLDQKLDVPKEQATGAMPQLPTVEGMTRMKKWNLPSNALAAFDTVARPKMDASLSQARAQMTQADTRRDTDRSKAINDAQDKVKAAHADADKQQQAKIADTRTQITNHQATTLVKHEAEIKKLDAQSSVKKQGTIGKINDRISADQAKVETDYRDAQNKAEDQKKQGEEDARKKKEEAEKNNKDESWWDRAADAVCDGIKAIADEIDKALDAIGKAIGSLLDAVKDAACKVIDAARDFVCQALTEFGDWLKSAVTALIGSVFPELAAELNRLIDEAVNAAKAAVNAVADGLKHAVTALCDSLKGALDGIIAAFKAAVQAAATFAQAAITGDWALVGKMILDGILELLGIDPAAFYALIGKAEDSIEKIIANPGAFVGHLIDAVKLGFKQFGANFWTHLKDGIVQWLFGTFAQAGITMPASFDVAGIFDLVCQVLGLTWPRLRGKVVKVIGENNTERLEFVAKYIQALITGGFSGLWQQIQHDMSGLWDMVIGGVKDWLIEKVVQQAIIKIATMWNPAGAIIQLIQTAWNVYQWVRENAQRIFGLVQAVVDSISNIVAGNIGGAANFIEASLAKLVPIAISLFADLLGLGGIADKIKSIIEKVQAKVDHAIDALIERVMKLFKGKDSDHKDGKDDKDEAPEIPKSLDESNKTTLTGLSEAVLREAAHTPSGTVLYTGGATDPKEATKAILANHPEARFDKSSKTLHLPAAKADASPSSLKALAAELGRSTGLPKITFVTTAKGWRLDGQINPTVEGLASYTGGAGRLKPLIDALHPDVGKQFDARAKAEKLCRERGEAHNANVHITVPLKTGTSRVTFTEKAPPGGASAEDYALQIVAVGMDDAALIDRAGGAGDTKQIEVKQRGGPGTDSALVNRGTASMAANPTFEADAKAFEDNFGRLAWGHRSANDGATTMANQAKAYIMAKVGSWDAANTDLQGLCAMIGRDNPGWSGAVGKEVHAVMACFDSGNIAEKMNHVGNFFIDILGNDLIDADTKDLTKWLTQARLDVKALMRRRDELKAQQAASGKRPSNWGVAPVAPGSPAEDQWHARADRADVQGVPRSDEAARSEVARSDRKLSDTGADMSDREIALAQSKRPWDPDRDALLWEEGAKVWMLNERDKWVQWQRKLSLPLGAGPSGSTNQLMQAAKALKVDVHGARAACIAYLLPAHHHTLVEILAAAAPFGCTYTGGQKMYRKIAPFSEDELRSCGRMPPGGTEKLFPDELSPVDGDKEAKAGPVKLEAAGGGGGAAP